MIGMLVAKQTRAFHNPIVNKDEPDRGNNEARRLASFNNSKGFL
jgi:hypothetical protein